MDQETLLYLNTEEKIFQDTNYIDHIVTTSLHKTQVTKDRVLDLSSSRWIEGSDVYRAFQTLNVYDKVSDWNHQ